MTTEFDYYVQNDKTKGVRRFPKGENQGQRWDRGDGQWSDACADRATCQLTHDLLLSEEQARQILPASAFALAPRPSPLATSR